MAVLILQLPFHPRHQWMHFFENEQSRWCSTSWKLFITLVLVHFCTFYPRADDSREWRWVIYLWVIHREGQVLNCHFSPTLPSLVLNSSPFRSPYKTGWWSKIDTGWLIRYWSDASSLLLSYCDEVRPNSQQGWLDQIRRRSGDGLRLLLSDNFTLIHVTTPPPCQALTESEFGIGSKLSRISHQLLKTFPQYIQLLMLKLLTLTLIPEIQDWLTIPNVCFPGLRYQHACHHPTIPYDTTPYHTKPYQTTPYQTIPYHTKPYHTKPYHIIPYDMIPSSIPNACLCHQHTSYNTKCTILPY